METSFEKIIRRTGRKPSQCKCWKCKEQCKTPCLGTPDDILRLLQAGYKNKLAPTAWCVGMALGRIKFPVPMVQAIQTAWGCIFFHDGLCELHSAGLKPTEGKLSHHSIKQENYQFKKSLSWNVAKEWLEEDNREIIRKIFREMSR